MSPPSRKSSAVDGSSRTHGVTPTRYSLVHGCYVIYSGAGRAHPIAPKAGPFRMQPAALAVYLLYGRHKQYVTDQGGGKIGTASTPSRASEWRVGGTARRGFTLTNIATKAKRPVTFVEATQCAKYPEAEVDASVAHELETGEFEVLRIPDETAERPRSEHP